MMRTPRGLSRWAGMLMAGLFAVSPSSADRADQYYYIDNMAVDPLERSEEARSSFNFESPAMRLAPDRRRTRQEARERRLPPTDPAEASAREWDSIRAARRLAEDKDWEGAKRQIEQALATNPNSDQLLRLAGLYSSMAGQYAVADLYYRRYVEANPDEPQYRAVWAGVLIRLGELERARRETARVLQENPNHLLARFNHTIIGILLGDPLSPAFDWDSTTLEEQLLLAHWLEADRQDLGLVLTDRQYDQLARIILGVDQGAEQVRQVRVAIQTLFTALKAEAVQEAKAALNELGSLGVDGLGVSMTEARLHYMEEEQEKAARALEDMTRTFPGNPAAWYNRGLVSLKLGAYEGAADAFERSIELSQPEVSPDARFGLAAALLQLDQPDAAWQMLDELLQDSPAELVQFLEGDSDYLKTIRGHARFPAFKERLEKRLGVTLPAL